MHYNGIEDVTEHITAYYYRPGSPYSLAESVPELGLAMALAALSARAFCASRSQCSRASSFTDSSTIWSDYDVSVPLVRAPLLAVLSVWSAGSVASARPDCSNMRLKSASACLAARDSILSAPAGIYRERSPCRMPSSDSRWYRVSWSTLSLCV